MTKKSNKIFELVESNGYEDYLFLGRKDNGDCDIALRGKNVEIAMMVYKLMQDDDAFGKTIVLLALEYMQKNNLAKVIDISGNNNEAEA
jgi:hypothetical protein